MRIGIDLGGTKTEGVVLDEQDKVLQRIRFKTPQSEGYQAILKNIAHLVDALEAAQDVKATVGIGMPGSISPHTGLVRNSNTVCLNGRSIQADLQEVLGREVRFANDANCFALSESIDGAAQGKAVVFGVILGTGTGGGVVINQRVVHGLQGIAGEWGHNPIGVETVYEKRDCYCGRNDCIETYLSGAGLLKNYEVLTSKRLTNVPALLKLLAQEEDAAVQAMALYHQRFGRALANVVNILDPDIIVLGGGLSNIEPLYHEGVAAMKQHVFSDFFKTPVVKNQHGDSSGVLGAARLWPLS